MVHEHSLLTIPAVAVTHLHDGEEAALGDSVPLTISMVEVPASSDVNVPPSYGDATTNRPGSPDTYLMIRLGELLELPLSALDKIIFQYPNFYIIPITDDGPSEKNIVAGNNGKQKVDASKGYVRVTLDMTKVGEEDKDTLDAILASWTTFNGGPGDEYEDHVKVSDTKDSKLATASGSTSRSLDFKQHEHGHLALVDEQTGHIVGDLSSTIQLEEEPALLSVSEMEKDPIGAKEPVVIQLANESDSTTQQQRQVATVSRLSQVRSQYGHSGSKIIGGAEWISRGILFGSETASSLLNGMSTSYVTKNPPTQSPLVFNARSRKSAQTVQSVTKTAVSMSGKAAHVIGEAAALIGDRVGKTTGIQRSSAQGKAPKGTRGLVNKSLVAFNTVFDALEHGGKHFLESASTSANTVVAHKYGEDAGEMSKAMTGTVQGVALVYVDIRGVSRKAILKSAGKAAIKGRMADGREVVLAPEGELQLVNNSNATSTSAVAGASGSGSKKPSVWSKFK